MDEHQARRTGLPDACSARAKHESARARSARSQARETSVTSAWSWRGSADRLFLPFNDDPVLSLILSKTFLLAAATEISARAILAQI